MTLKVETARDSAELAARAAERLDTLGGDCIARQGRFVVSLAGGSTPKALYRLWGERSRLDWTKVHLLFGDERCVPPDHPDSNAGMVEAALLGQLKARPQVHRMLGEDPDPHRAARQYEQELHDLLGGEGAIDLALLGIGGDGHTASLFPGAEALGERERTCVATLAPDGETRRITLTVPALARAREIWFLAAGTGTAGIVQRVLEGPLEREKYPSQFLLRDESLTVTLLLDEAAAG